MNSNTFLGSNFATHPKPSKSLKDRLRLQAQAFEGPVTSTKPPLKKKLNPNSGSFIAPEFVNAQPKIEPVPEEKTPEKTEKIEEEVKEEETSKTIEQKAEPKIVTIERMGADDLEKLMNGLEESNEML